MRAAWEILQPEYRLSEMPQGCNVGVSERFKVVKSLNGHSTSIVSDSCPEGTYVKVQSYY
ncbi:MAG TPA: hypothetical protein DEG47_06030 [Cyanobacteria bacterium UBA11148]|nr:hypothetical protein [Cyanobacteria bacterium UBA11148]